MRKSKEEITRNRIRMGVKISSIEGRILNNKIMSNQGKAVKKPIPIDWFKYTGDIEKLGEWIGEFDTLRSDVIEVTDTGLKIKTLEGSSYELPQGYFVLRGIRGEFYPCESQIFEESYNVL